MPSHTLSERAKNRAAATHKVSKTAKARPARSTVRARKSSRKRGR